LLADEGAVLACMAYVDLNPVRAKLADSLEASEFTSIHDRLVARKARAGLAALEESESGPAADAAGKGGRGMAEAESPANEAGQAARTRSTKVSKPTPAQEKLLEAARADARADGWLCPLPEAAEASDRPSVLGINEEGYLALVDWTGRNLALGKRGSLPADLRPLLENLELETERWVETVSRYGGLFHRVAGRVESLRHLAEAMGQRWLAGVRASRTAFRAGDAVA
jgi:hypothetical protein